MWDFLHVRQLHAECWLTGMPVAQLCPSLHCNGLAMFKWTIQEVLLDGKRKEHNWGYYPKVEMAFLLFVVMVVLLIPQASSLEFSWRLKNKSKSKHRQWEYFLKIPCKWDVGGIQRSIFKIQIFPFIPQLCVMFWMICFLWDSLDYLRFPLSYQDVGRRYQTCLMTRNSIPQQPIHPESWLAPQAPHCGPSRKLELFLY